MPKPLWGNPGGGGGCGALEEGDPFEGSNVEVLLAPWVPST